MSHAAFPDGRQPVCHCSHYVTSCLSFSSCQEAEWKPGRGGGSSWRTTASITSNTQQWVLDYEVDVLISAVTCGSAVFGIQGCCVTFLFMCQHYTVLVLWLQTEATVLLMLVTVGFSFNCRLIQEHCANENGCSRVSYDDLLSAPYYCYTVLLLV